MFNLFDNELKKIFSQKKIYIFAVIYVIFTICIVILSKTLSESSSSYTGQTFPTQLIAFHLELLTPVLIVILVADLICGEKQEGTLNLFLTKPVSRFSVLFSKALALLVTMIAIFIFNMILSYIASTIAFGWGKGYQYGMYNLSTFNGLRVTFTTYIVSVIPQFGFAMIAMFISTLVKDKGTAIAISVSLLFFLSIMANVSQVQTYLINSYFSIYSILISGTANATLLKYFGIIGLYIVLFFTGSALVFRKKDIA